jgi:ABC-type nitrate/sulfonate/bicarbonate transport system substrate-binding protein
MNAPTPNNELAPVRVNVFPGGFNWGLYVGVDKEFFAREGLGIEVQHTPNSVTQMTDFAAGKFEIAMTGVDNIVAYVEGQGEAPIGPQPDFFAFMGSDSAFLSLVCGPDIKEISALRGKQLLVDAMTTGYAFVLYDILRRAGLPAETYDVARAGGMIERWTRLQAGQGDGTLLSAPYNLIAKAHGLNEIVRAVETIGPYQGNVGAARRSWANANEKTVVGYIRAYRDAIDWLYVPDNRSDAIAILTRNLPHMAEEVARASYDELLHPKFGFYRGGEIDQAGLACVLALRSRYGKPQMTLDNPNRYIDRRFLEASRRTGA